MQNRENSGGGNRSPQSGGQPSRLPGGSSRQPDWYGNRERQPARSPGGRQEPPRSPSRRPPGGKKPRKAKGNRWFRAIVMVLATLALCVFLSTFILESASDLFGLNQEDQVIPVEIPDGVTFQEAAEILSEAGVVDKPLTFRLYSMLKNRNGDVEFLGGEYNFNSNMGYDQLISALRYGISDTDVVDLYFIEGRTVYEIANLLEEYGVCDAEEFLEYLETANDLDYEFVDRLPDSEYRFRRLEGYVFPDTYTFYVPEKVSSVAGKFLDNFESKITEDMEERMQELNMSLDEVVTLASIIQKEAGEEDHMRRVSAVFHNRLNMSQAYPRLQSDVTIHYVEKFIKPFVETTDQDMYDAYNTYVTEGLPVGPICNPGLAAIQAALDPAESSNYFFVTDDEGIYYYAETAEQHYQNVTKAEAVGGKDIHGTNTSFD